MKNCYPSQRSAVAVDGERPPIGDANLDVVDLHLETTFIPALHNTISYALRSAGASRYAFASSRSEPFEIVSFKSNLDNMNLGLCRFASAWLDVKEKSQTAYAEAVNDICELPAIIGPCKLRVGRYAQTTSLLFDLTTLCIPKTFHPLDFSSTPTPETASLSATEDARATRTTLSACCNARSKSISTTKTWRGLKNHSYRSTEPASKTRQRSI